ncbi:hypothetical protein H2204_015010 [Knufia peltigerae]|nr:hypothetical protein H2204_015010 [Knufia peltigerae]
MVGRTRGRHARDAARVDASRRKNSCSQAPSPSAANVLASRPVPQAQQPCQDNLQWSSIPTLPEGRSSVCSDIDFSSHDSFSERPPGESYYNADLFSELLDDTSLEFFNDQGHHTTPYLPNHTPKGDVIEAVRTSTAAETPNRHDAPVPPPPPQPNKVSDSVGLGEGLSSRSPNQNIPLSQQPRVTNNQDAHATSWKDIGAFMKPIQCSIPCSSPSARSQNIMTCASILSSLEEVCECVYALDEALRINKESMNQIGQLIGSPCCRESPSSMVILVQGLLQIVDMLERSCTDVYPGLKEASARRWNTDGLKRPPNHHHFGARTISTGFRTAQAAALPGVGFGCFNLDPEEQQLIQVTIISRELCRTLEVIRSLAVPLANFVREGRKDMEVTRQVLGDLEHRIAQIELYINCGK